MNNARFESYYKTQAIVPEDQWDAFLDALREPLPTTFRVAGSRQLCLFYLCLRFSLLKGTQDCSRFKRRCEGHVHSESDRPCI